MKNDTRPGITLTLSGSRMRASVTCAMLSSRMQAAIRLPKETIASQNYGDLTTAGQHLVDKLDKIEGLTFFMPADAYSCDLEKADAYAWDELVPEVQTALSEIYNEINGTSILLDDFRLLTLGLPN